MSKESKEIEIIVPIPEKQPVKIPAEPEKEPQRVPAGK